jgi:hypothetical protein
MGFGEFATVAIFVVQQMSKARLLVSTSGSNPFAPISAAVFPASGS